MVLKKKKTICDIISDRKQRIWWVEKMSKEQGPFNEISISDAKKMISNFQMNDDIRVDVKQELVLGVIKIFDKDSNMLSRVRTSYPNAATHLHKMLSHYGLEKSWIQIDFASSLATINNSDSDNVDFSVPSAESAISNLREFVSAGLMEAWDLASAELPSVEKITSLMTITVKQDVEYDAEEIGRLRLSGNIPTDVSARITVDVSIPSDLPLNGGNVSALMDSIVKDWDYFGNKTDVTNSSHIAAYTAPLWSTYGDIKEKLVEVFADYRSELNAGQFLQKVKQTVVSVLPRYGQEVSNSLSSVNGMDEEQVLQVVHDMLAVRKVEAMSVERTMENHIEPETNKITMPSLTR
jgi:hypothetical protein